jgi:hypothetical protein
MRTSARRGSGGSHGYGGRSQVRALASPTLLVSPETLNESTETLPGLIVVFLKAGAVVGAVEEILGVLEGLLLAFPPVSILGLS